MVPHGIAACRRGDRDRVGVVVITLELVPDRLRAVAIVAGEDGFVGFVTIGPAGDGHGRMDQSLAGIDVDAMTMPSATIITTIIIRAEKDGPDPNIIWIIVRDDIILCIIISLVRISTIGEPCGDRIILHINDFEFVARVQIICQNVLCPVLIVGIQLEHMGRIQAILIPVVH